MRGTAPKRTGGSRLHQPRGEQVPPCTLSLPDLRHLEPSEWAQCVPVRPRPLDSTNTSARRVTLTEAPPPTYLYPSICHYPTILPSFTHHKLLCVWSSSNQCPALLSALPLGRPSEGLGNPQPLSDRIQERRTETKFLSRQDVKSVPRLFPMHSSI